MTASHSILTAFVACSLLAMQAQAQTQQPLAGPAGPAVQTVQPAPDAQRSTPSLASTAGAGLKMTVALRGLANASTFTAAGSVVLLADGIVADARIAQVQPPAPGFQYER